MFAEMNTIEVELKDWSLVKQEPWIMVLPFTRAFCIEQFPNGLVKKFKTHICVHGGCQIEEFKFFET
jgi:hypothetical protein